MEAIEHNLYCPHCGNESTQRLVYSQTHFDNVYPMGDLESKGEKSEARSFVTECMLCHHLLVYDDNGAVLYDEAFAKADRVWPEPTELHRAVPADVRDIYAEAIRVKKLAPNAFAVQIRKALEAVCSHLGERKGTLHARLERLWEKGDIPPALAKVTNMIRDLGNAGAHGNKKSVHPIEVHAINEMFLSIVDYVWVIPFKIEWQKKYWKR